MKILIRKSISENGNANRRGSEGIFHADKFCFINLLLLLLLLTFGYTKTNLQLAF